MLHPVKSDDGLSCRVLFFYFFLLSTFSGALSDLICSHQPIVAVAGDDVILPCHLEPAVSVSTVEWSRPGLDPKYVHVYKDGRTIPQSQNPSYRFRTKLFTSELKNGNVSLKILRVKMSDTGKYQCVLPSNEEAFIELSVGDASTPASTPTIEVLSNDSLSVVLNCKSKGWYPEPEVVWLDGEGNLLSAGPTETFRGPEGLYTVSSRVTVEKRTSNSFTCRVQQKNINQTRETQIHVSADPIKPPDTLMSVTTILYIVLLVVVLVLLAVAVFFFNKLRRTTDPNKRLRIFLSVAIIVLLLLLVFFVAVSAIERLKYTNDVFNPLEMLMIICVILILVLFLVLFAVSIFILKKLNDAYDPGKRLDIFLIVNLTLLLLLLLAFVVIGVKEMGRGYGQFMFLLIFWIVDLIDDLLLLLPDAVRNVKKQTDTSDPFKRLKNIFDLCLKLYRTLLYLAPFSIAVSVIERLKYSTDPLSPVEIVVIVSIFLLPSPLFLLFLDVFSNFANLQHARNQRNQRNQTPTNQSRPQDNHARKKKKRQVQSRSQNVQTASNDTPPEQIASVDRSTTD